MPSSVLRSALDQLASDAWTDDRADAALTAMAAETDLHKLTLWLDWLAARNADDPRWDAYRARRRYEASHAN